MRCILTGCLAAGLGWIGPALAQDAGGAAGNPMGQRAVTLGPPTVSLGAPRPVPMSARGDISPCGFGIVGRATVDDKAPMPAGPVLPSGPATASAPLPAPTPLPSADAGTVVPGSVLGGPVVGEFQSTGLLPGEPCANACCPDAGWAPLPGGSFAAEGRPCGYILYGSTEALFMWLRSSQLPPLLTLSPPGLGVPPSGTRVIFGNQDVAPNERLGGRVTVGWWLNECQNWGVVGSYFFLAQRGMNFAAAGDGMNVLARPFFNINPGAGGSPSNPVAARDIIAAPGLATGSFAATTSNELWGADINARMNLLRGCRWRLDGLVGFRYLQFDESLDMVESGQLIAPGVPAISATLMDSFHVKNNFYGGQVGLIGEIHRGPWSLDMIGKVALGTTHETLDALGAQSGFNPASGPFTGAGLLVQPSNAGSHTRDAFAVVPEVNFNVGYQMTQHLKLFAGYDFLCWSRVARVADQIDQTVDLNTRQVPAVQPPGATRPAVLFHDTALWAQGFNVGLQFTW
jgi:hypothetical protein